MNIFATDFCPRRSAQVLPDKHVVKMPLECCQMVSIVYSKWYHDWGVVPRKDSEPYQTKGGAFRNHPCTKWAADNIYNLAWLIAHGCALTTEYTYRYNKVHACAHSLFEAKKLFHRKTKKAIIIYRNVEGFARAMPDEFKLDTSIDDLTAYKMYIASKPWVSSNYLRKPDRKPDWI